VAGTPRAFGFRRYAHRHLGQIQFLFNRRFDRHEILEHWLGRLLRLRRAHFAQSVRLNHLADQAPA
jgi:hypothetical protein